MKISKVKIRDSSWKENGKYFVALDVLDENSFICGHALIEIPDDVPVYTFDPSRRKDDENVRGGAAL